ncbi:leucine/isoleucine/valine transporter subunit; ATP-binding component of ABC superfamily [Thiomonas sp. X19]|uniref:ABC transporter ATP-binding protein n=1 Tax=Thiomonas sp. X19 TaxID=1050370 RepID=UPI000B7453EF|nr:ABC transporter ATP-binding protein [Thiomonas sp. X19]SCC93953.1 leucine/isoleucine/valine transporter subunit; ATP-binding component of ABC superfamily [Thiomonas sp. X19]
MLRLEGLTVGYDAFLALQGVDLQVRDGELVVLLGANGAGKSSLFHALSGLLRIRAGRAWWGGLELTRMRAPQIVAHGVVHCPEGRKLFGQLSVLKNLQLGAYVHRLRATAMQQRLEQVFTLFPVLAEKRAQPAGSLSGGQQQMVAIGRALMGQPRLLLLDEPSLGLAPLVVKQMFEVVQAINQAGTTVLLAEQNAHAALRIAHRGYVIEQGRVVMKGSADALLHDEGIRRAYIGT